MRFCCAAWLRLFLLALCINALTLAVSAQETAGGALNALRQPSWNYGFQIYGGTATMATPPIPGAPGRYPSSWGAEFHLARVLTNEHVEGWGRGTLEWDLNLIPVVNYYAAGRTYYMAGLEAVSARWNFTRINRRFVPFFGFDGGMLMGPDQFPPGDTSRFNFTVGLDLGAHIFTRQRQSFDTTIRLHHLSNAETGHYNPGVPLSIQLMLGYTWF